MDLKELEKKVLKLAEDGEDMAKKHADLQKAHADLMEKHSALQKKLEEKGDDADGDKEGASGDVDQDEDTMDPEKLKKQLADAKAKLAEYAENQKKLEEAKQMAEKESKFNVLLSEGKACVAQKDSFLKGDMEAFIKLSQPLNLTGKGSSSSSGAAAGDREDQVLKLAEDKVKADPKLAMVDAIKLANREIK